MTHVITDCASVAASVWMSARREVLFLGLPAVQNGLISTLFSMMHRLRRMHYRMSDRSHLPNSTFQRSTRNDIEQTANSFREGQVLEIHAG